MATTLELIDTEAVDEDFDLLQAIIDRAHLDGWTDILTECLDILANPEQQTYWSSAMRIIYWSLGHESQCPTSKMAIVARLYWCLIQDSPMLGEGLDDPGNLVWSIAHELKGVSYNSDWDPQKDPEVLAHLATFG